MLNINMITTINNENENEKSKYQIRMFTKV